MPKTQKLGIDDLERRMADLAAVKAKMEAAEYRRLKAAFTKAGIASEKLTHEDLEKALKSLGEGFRGSAAVGAGASKKGAA